VKLHLSEYKRELIRLEEALRKVLPLIKESNVMAGSLGRCVKFEAALLTHIPQSMAYAPVEELLTQKVTSLQIRCVLANPRTEESREWHWSPEHFYDRIGLMRQAWMEWMLKEQAVPMHSPADPFWTKPVSQLVGTAYVYLAPVAFGCVTSDWVPIANYRGERQGELRVHLKPSTKPTNDPDTLLGKPITFTLTVEGARDMIHCPNKNVQVDFSFADETSRRKTAVSVGRKPTHVFAGGEFELSLPPLDETHIAYLCKDALCFEVWGERDDVEEADVAEAVVFEQPPEEFQLFVAHDLTVADTGEHCVFEQDCGKKGEPGFVVAQETAHKLTLSLTQENKNFRVASVGRIMLGNVRAQGSKKAVDSEWQPLQIASQAREKDSETGSWIVECDLTKLPKYLQTPEAVGLVFDVDLKAEVQEIERLGALEEPLGVTKKLTFRVVGAGEDTPKPVAFTKSESTRRRRFTVVQEDIYLGTFELTDNAVNEAMQAMRETSSDHDEASAKEILAAHDKQVEARKQQLIAEVARQSEDLMLRSAPLGLELGPVLEMWQLPSELLGGGGGALPEDVAALQKLVGELKMQLADQHEQLQTAKKKIIELESGAQNAPKLNRRSSSSKMSKRDSKRVLPGDEEPAPLWKEPLKDAAAVDPPPPKSAGCVLL